MINIESVQALVRTAYLPHAREAFGEDGSLAITRLLDAIKLIYQRVPPESVTGTLTVLFAFKATPSLPLSAAWGAPSSHSSYEELQFAFSRVDGRPHIIIELVPDGSFRFLRLATDIDLKAAAGEAIVYRYENGVDRFLAKNFDDYVQKISPILGSNFANATLSNLEEALTRYGQFVLDSKCRILATAWEGGVDGPRLVLVNRPESIMRDSLVQALELVLRDSNARPEHNTDETKPVDIRVEFFASSAAALIEVKWLGRATAKSRNNHAATTYTDYNSARAQEGADQLADYLDREKRHSASSSTRGYLVVFDARRRNVKGAADALIRADAMHFAHSDIEYDPNYTTLRDDFAVPRRLFLNPRESSLAVA